MQDGTMKVLETQVIVDDFINTFKDMIERGAAADENPESAELMAGFVESFFPILEVAKMVYMMKIQMAAMGFPLDDKS